MHVPVYYNKAGEAAKAGKDSKVSFFLSLIKREGEGERERGRENASGGEGQRERDRIPSRLHTRHRELGCDCRPESKPHAPFTELCYLVKHRILFLSAHTYLILKCIHVRE